MFSTVIGMWMAAFTLTAAGEGADIPFAEALSRADIQQTRIDNVLNHGLIIGNGDINALVYSSDGRVIVSLTKNDVWDARLLTENDPPLPTLARLKALASEGWAGEWILPEGMEFDGNDSYHANPFPCPLQCAEVVLDTGFAPTPETTAWKVIRAEGTRNEFVKEGAFGLMRIAGKAENSNGFQLDLDQFSGANYPRLAVRVRGTDNARFFVDVMGVQGHPCLSSGWQNSPRKSTDFTFDLPENQVFGAIILYTWTADGDPAENVFERVAFEGDGDPVVLPLGAPPNVAMPAHLSLEKAVATIDAVPGLTRGAVVRALAQRNVFLITSEAPAELRTVTPSFLPEATVERGDMECIVQEVPGDLDWQGMRYAVAMARRESQIAVGIMTSLESSDPRAAAIALVKEALAEPPEQSVAKHEALWRDYWSASGVAMGDAVLEQNWYRSLYFLRCVTKPGVVSPGLFAGLINATPAWHGDYHLNYNLQQTFWSAYITNHCELAEPYDRLMRDYVKRGQWLAQQVYDCEGAFYPHVLYAYEPEDPATCKSVNGRQYIHHVWGMTLGVAGFAVQPLWWHYKYAPDTDLLRDTVYPPLREVALFYADFIDTKCEHREDGLVHLGPSVSPEHWGWTKHLARNYYCAFDIAMVRYTLEAAVEAAGMLDADATLVKRWRDVLEMLPPYPMSPDKPPVVVDVRDAPPIEYNISVPATPVYPGDVVTWWSDEEEKALFTRTIDTLRWNGNNATFMLAISRARLSMEDTPGWLRTEITARQRPNGTLTLNRLGHQFNTFGHYTEQFGAAQAVSELLLQSVSDIVRVLPAWPLNEKVHFHQLRAQGGFLVSGGCEAGAILPVTVTSTVGGPLRMAVPWKRVEVRRGDTADTVTPDARGVITVETVADQEIVIAGAT